MRHGKGKKYIHNGILLYEGDYKYDRAEGEGYKLLNDCGYYYIGQFSNGLMNGKGKMYDKRNKLVYEGDFKNDKPDGIGKEYFENGEYYIGPFFNGLKHGKGTIFHPNGNIKCTLIFIFGNIETNSVIFSRENNSLENQISNDNENDDSFDEKDIIKFYSDLGNTFKNAIQKEKKPDSKDCIIF